MNPGLTVPDDDALILAADGADEHRNLPAAVFAVDRLAAVARKFALGHADDAGAAVACAARHADQRDARLAGEVVRDSRQPPGARGLDRVPQIVGADRKSTRLNSSH